MTPRQEYANDDEDREPDGLADRGCKGCGETDQEDYSDESGIDRFFDDDPSLLPTLLSLSLRPEDMAEDAHGVWNG